MTHAQIEFKLLKEQTPDAIILEFEKEIIALYDKIMNSGQSGGSMPIVASSVSFSLERLLNQETFIPLSGKDEEWVDMSEYNGGELMLQNIRNSSVFMDKSGAYYIDAIIFVGDKTGYFTGSATLNDNRISSHQYIKEFPFTPKKFFVDVIDIENGDHVIKDENKLKEALEYYNTP